jgi:hypothetical protein
MYFFLRCYILQFDRYVPNSTKLHIITSHRHSHDQNISNKKQNELRGLNSKAKYTYRATAACRGS